MIKKITSNSPLYIVHTYDDKSMNVYKLCKGRTSKYYAIYTASKPRKNGARTVQKHDYMKHIYEFMDDFIFNPGDDVIVEEYYDENTFLVEYFWMLLL